MCYGRGSCNTDASGLVPYFSDFSRFPVRCQCDSVNVNGVTVWYTGIRCQEPSSAWDASLRVAVPCNGNGVQLRGFDQNICVALDSPVPNVYKLWVGDTFSLVNHQIEKETSSDSPYNGQLLQTCPRDTMNRVCGGPSQGICGEPVLEKWNMVPAGIAQTRVDEFRLERNDSDYHLVRKCQCRNGWKGEACEIPVCLRDSNGQVCSKRGLCDHDSNRCVCFGDAIGWACELQDRACANNAQTVQ
jgi:hypothetical protein